MLIVTIGHDPACDIVLKSETVSAKHAILYLHDSGTLVLEDNASLNGTYVNSRSMPIMMRQRISLDDTLYFSDEGVTVQELLEHVRANKLGKRRAEVIRCPLCWKPMEESRTTCPSCGRKIK
jgi:pSer/pThr/pTyr-binding forkhead associated (FHA) protein